MSTDSPKVIIIGGGLAVSVPYEWANLSAHAYHHQGPTLALNLRKYNISSVIFELRKPDASDGGFLALAPNALRVLNEIGVYERISNQGCNFEELN